jgi:hypothetical protein
VAIFTASIAASIVASSSARAQDGLQVSVSAMADIAYSITAQPLSGHQRSYTTQPSRDREIGLMLGLVRADAVAPWYRARLGLQTGWFPVANYLGRDADWRHLHEANIGIRVLDSVWLDVGVMPSHIGYESMVPRTNIVLSRSLTADNTPYYETGGMITWRPTATVQISGLLLNGWQRIVDNNGDLAIGTRVFVAPTSDLGIAWSTYVGNDQPSPLTPRLRYHNNAWVEWKATPALTFVGLMDLCLQDQGQGGMDRQWSLAGIAAWRAWSGGTVAVRAERYDDADRLFVTTPSGAPARITGLSCNIDHTLTTEITVRAELRHFDATSPIFQTTSGARHTETFMTVSVSAALSRIL